ncbi:MAG: DUF2326 domain-containing protein [Desulfobacterales bacterium]|nr:DUF2326 domain-containing protein [Desulfobacterales bacterium]
MKLSKLYANQPHFKNIKFNPGFNVIYADVKTKDNNRNSHCLGKSLLIDLIDFLLLKKIKKNHPFYKTTNEAGYSIFNDYIFYLEIILNSARYLTIQRSVADNTKISFSLNETSADDFIPPANWNPSELPLEKAKKQLAEYLNFDFFMDKKYDYRKAISYCLRKQGDYQNIYRLTKFKSGRDIFWKPFMFDILGFNGKLLEDKYEKESKISEIDKFIKTEEKEFDIHRDEKDEIKGLILIKEKEKTELIRQLDRFNFYQQDKENIHKLVDEIEQKISELNTECYNVEFEISRLQKSIKNKFAFNLEKVQTVFNEVKIYFQEQLKKDYNDLLDFNNKLTSERNRFLRETLSIRLEEQKNIKKQLEELNEQKSELLSYIQDTDVFKKFKEYQKKAVEAESEILSLQSKLNAIDIIGNKQKVIKKYQTEIESLIDKINTELDKSSENVIYTGIRTVFSNYYKIILDETAILSLRLNKYGNIDFNEPKVQNKATKQMTQQGDGFTYTKLFCVCFDLALLTIYRSNSFFRFVYHDDVFANQDNRPKLKLLGLIKELCNKYDIQYIFTIIRDEIPYDEKNQRIKFSEKEIVLELHDKDETGTLFGFVF